ncbi:hypothetical protein [Microbacterium sp. bgisy203]|uniref:hypothetical protein n=1 Tax=Microbacterium sp. bgisy203 TaxID=3413799 RepID=UPI003D761A31
MKSEQVDERDSAWEDDQPRFRFSLFTGAGSAVRTMDLWDCTVTQALVAASESDDEGLWSLALVGERDGVRGLTWLSGYDYNDAPTTPTQWRARAEMQNRYLSRRAIRGDPIVLPNGLRVVRMFPEWVGGPLWESSTDNYPADSLLLGLSPALSADVAEWNEQWGRRDVDEALPNEAAWLARGWELWARVRDELAGVAEVHPEFAY